MVAAALVAAVALVAVEDASHRQFALLAVPALACGVVSMSPLRRVAMLADQSVDDSAELLAFLRLAPLNVLSLTIGVCGDSVFARVVAVLQDCPCHSYLTALHFDDDEGDTYELSVAAAATLLDATGGLRYLRAATVGGEGASAILAAARPQLRSFGVGATGRTTFDMTAFTALRHASHVWDSDEVSRIVMPPSLRTIGMMAWSRLTALTSVDIAATTVKCVGSYFLSRCTALTTVLLPPTLTRFGAQAFTSCSGLTTLDFSHTAVHTVETGFLSDCTALTSVAFPPTLRCIEAYGFSRCLALPSLDLSHTMLESVGSPCGTTCKLLKNVYLPATAASVPNDVFRYGTVHRPGEVRELHPL
jgi:hypothetical protein